MTEDNSLNQLSALYESPGWKHFEKWIDGRIEDLIQVIIDPETPMEEADRIRVAIFTFRAIKDKVTGDKLTKEQMDTQQE